MGIAYTPARSASIKYETALGAAPSKAVATSARQDEWTVSLGEHHFLLNGARHKAEELLQAYGELYDLAFPITAKPRELQSLDCEEARDGTVWVDSDPHMPWSYRFNGEWAYARGHANSWSHWKPLTVRGLLTSSRLYTEVVE